MLPVVFLVVLLGTFVESRLQRFDVTFFEIDVEMKLLLQAKFLLGYKS